MVYLKGTGNGRDHALRIAEVRDIDGCMDIARQSFKYDRFHADPKFPNKQADDLKAHWVERNILEDDVWVLGDPPMGFISIKMGPQEPQREWRIDLVAVDPEFQRMGFGRKLIEHALVHHPNINVGTQEKNPALKLYEDLGFEIVRTEDVYHE